MGVVQKVGNFLGVKKFADAMATTTRVLTGEVDRDIALQAQDDENIQKIVYALKREKDPVKKQKLTDLAKNMMNNKSQQAGQIDPGLNLSAKEVYGSGANVVLNAAMPSGFKGGVKAVIGKNAALGSAMGASSGMEQNRSASGVVGSAVGGALVGGTVGAAGASVKAVKDFIGKATPEWLMNKAVKPALADLRKNVKYGTDTLGKELLNEGVKGGAKRLLEIADDKTTLLEKELEKILTDKRLEGAMVKRDNLAKYLQEMVSTKLSTPGNKGELKRISDIFYDMPEEMTLLEANKMKRRIYTELKDVAYKIDAKLGTKSNVLKQIARGLKTEIENEVGGTIVKDINRKLSIYGRLENSMVDQLAREMRNNGLGITDAMLMSGGGATTILALLRHVGQFGMTNTAQALKKVDKIGTGVVGKTTKEVIRRSALNTP